MKIKEWRTRVESRNDIVTRLTHLTRATEDMDALEVLFKILCEKKLVGSTTESGYIVGKTPAVCFQDMPLAPLAEHILYENGSFDSIEDSSVRYCGVGIRCHKGFVYGQGGRPVMYDKTNVLKRILPQEEYWRIVNLDLDDVNNYVDWTHEREWRVPNEMKFNYQNIEIILPTDKVYRKFMKLCEETGKQDMLEEVHGILVLSSIVY